MNVTKSNYNAGRILPILFVVYVILRGLADSEYVKRYWKGLLALLATAGLFLMPLLFYAWRHPGVFNGRAQFLFVGHQIQQEHSLSPLLFNLKYVFLMFNYRAWGADFFRHEPLFLFPTAVFFLTGLSIAITKWKKPPVLLFLLSLGFGWLTCLFTYPAGHRLIMAVPAACLFVGAGILWTSGLCASVFRTRYRNVIQVGLILLFLVPIVSGNIRTYHSPKRRTLWGFYPEATIVGEQMSPMLKKGFQVCVVAQNWPRDVLTYLSYSGNGSPFNQNYLYFEQGSSAMDRLSRPFAQSTAFIVEKEPHNTNLVVELLRQYPDALHFPLVNTFLDKRWFATCYLIQRDKQD